MIETIELFAGIGGFRYGLERASNKYKVIWANDIDKYASYIYREHYWKTDSEFFTGDFRIKSGTEEIPKHKLLCGGFPCQSFSIAGNRRGFEDTRGTLFFEICKTIQFRRPKCVLLENVKGLLSHDNGQTFYTILRCMDELGYDCEWQLLNSKDFNVPQNRERVYIVGHSREESQTKIFPIPESIIVYSEQPTRQFYFGGKGIAHTLDANYFKGIAMQSRTIINCNNTFRYLTPIECERLQGFPDNWTQGIPEAERYRCLGNAVTTTITTAIGKLLLKCF